MELCLAQDVKRAGHRESAVSTSVLIRRDRYGKSCRHARSTTFERRAGAFVKVLRRHGSRAPGERAFGYGRGGIHGCPQAQDRKFEAAHRGRSFLDGSVTPFRPRPKLLCPSGREFSRIGGKSALSVDVGCSPHQSELERAVAEGQFPKICTTPHVNPRARSTLRERTTRISLLVQLLRRTVGEAVSPRRFTVPRR